MYVFPIGYLLPKVNITDDRHCGAAIGRLLPSWRAGVSDGLRDAV